MGKLYAVPRRVSLEGEPVNEHGLDYSRLVKGVYGIDQTKGPISDLTIA